MILLSVSAGITVAECGKESRILVAHELHFALESFRAHKARNFALRHGMRTPPRNILRGARFVLPDRLTYVANSVQVVKMIPLAVVAGMKALSLAAVTNSARTLNLSVLDIRDKAARMRASPASEISRDGLAGIVHADFARVAPKSVVTLAALGNLAADSDEFPRVPVRSCTVLETLAGYVLDSIKI